jgi:signal transduction histidine kinase
LLALLATLQWQWIGELSSAERRRMLTSLEGAADRYTDDFDRELARAVMQFHPDPRRAEPPTAEWLVDRWRGWLAEAPYPTLVRVLMRAGGAAEPACFTPQRAAFEACPDHAVAEAVRDGLRSAVAGSGEAAEVLPVLLPAIPAVAIPFAPGGLGEAISPSFIVVVLDQQVMVDGLLPDLTERHFASRRGDGYALAVVAPGSPPRLLYTSDADLAAEIVAAPDAMRPLPGMRPFSGPPADWRERHEHMAMRRTGPRERDSPRVAPWLHILHEREMRTLPRSSGDPAVWTLMVKRRSGTVEQAVARFRSHNLAISVLVLGLIGATSVIMTLSAQRAQRLARQRIEFVAGVTHELHTPLTAICSAGENLADGVVAEPAQVKRYGVLIEREGRRLADMVAQVLELAGIESGRREYRRERLAVRDLVGEALAASRWSIEEAGVTVESEVEEGLPDLEADAAALGRALRNLIENAVKYGGAERWLAVRARREEKGVTIEVADRGRGVAREDLPHLFEPFYRGGSAAAQAAGSGLGLSLVRQIVEAHGGSVTVGTGDGGKGAVFAVHLPAAGVA